MHIPDGYLSPATCGVMYAAAVPFWVIAAERVRKALSGRMVPLLSIFAAFTFAIMMFNVPVPGGTTAHGVGGTLTAIVLGPWAAVITTSVALILQALFFGDGGITAIGANCFNMAIVLPFAGYMTYRMLAGNSDVFSQRRVISAAVGSYVGITIAALLVGIELGIQPGLWSHNGIPEYSPYGLSTAIPSMLLSHMAGASFVEAAITALAVGYLQRSFPEILRHSPGMPEAGASENARSPWVPVLGFGVFALVAMFVAGLIKGHGHIDHWAGLDWTTVNWDDAGLTVLVSAAVTVVVLPIIAYALRRSRGAQVAITVFVGLMIWVPIGLIAPGGAFAEESSASQAEVNAAVQARASGHATLFDSLPDINKHCECVPSKISSVNFSGSTPLAGYEPPWVKAEDPAWKQNLGYQVAGFAGIGIFAILGLLLYQFGRWLVPNAPPDWRTAPNPSLTMTAVVATETPNVATGRRKVKPAKPGFVEKTLAGITGGIENAVFSEENARRNGFLQRRDARIKLVCFVFLVVATSVSRHWPVLASLYALTLVGAAVSQIDMVPYFKRVWLGMGMFSAVVVFPSIFFVGHEALFQIPLGLFKLTVHTDGLAAAGIFILRVCTSVSLAILLILTTRWADILKSLRVLKVPAVFVLVLAMTYRYVFLVLHTANGMFQARKSRMVARTSGSEERWWIVSAIGVLMNRSFRMSDDVYQAMLARGFHNEIKTMTDYRLTAIDWLLLAGSATAAVLAVYADRIWL